MFSWADFLNISKNLSNGSDEASYRSSISRAYYATLHLCKQKLIESDDSFSEPRGGDTHRQIIDHYKRQSKGILKTIGIQLDSLKLKRIKSDYKLSPTVTQDHSRQAIKLSETIIGKLENVREDLFD